MKWTLIRKLYREDGIFGEMTSEDNKHVFQTLEHAYDDGVKYVPKIRVGLRPVILYKSPKQGYLVPMLDGEEDKERYFQIHIGNYNEDSEGCILVGLAKGHRANGGVMLTSSKQAFELLMKVGITELEVDDGL